MRFGEEARAARLARGWTQRELGDRVGISSAQVCRIELGRRTPGLQTLLKLSEELGLEVSLERLRAA